jgi:FMN reductase
VRKRHDRDSRDPDSESAVEPAARRRGGGQPEARLAHLPGRGLLVVFASPTYKASYTGLLKVFLDRFPSNGLDGVVAVPLMLGAGPGHQLAPEVFLKPVLAELGAVLPSRALYVVDSAFDDPAAYEAWLAASRRRIVAAAGVA